MLHFCLSAILQVLPMAASRILTFEGDLRSGLALYAVLVSHWPELARLGTKLRTAPADEGHLRDNATIVVKLVETLQLPYSLQVRLGGCAVCMAAPPLTAKRRTQDQWGRGRQCFGCCRWCMCGVLHMKCG